MLVKPAAYSPAMAPCTVRAAPAKKRNTSAMAGISSPLTAASGLPQFCDSIEAYSAASLSIRSASFRSSAARSFGGVAAQAEKAACAAATAASIYSFEASGTEARALPLAGSRIFSTAPRPATSLPLISNWVCMAMGPFSIRTCSPGRAMGCKQSLQFRQATRQDGITRVRGGLCNQYRGQPALPLRAVGAVDLLGGESHVHAGLGQMEVAHRTGQMRHRCAHDHRALHSVQTHRHALAHAARPVIDQHHQGRLVGERATGRDEL